MNVEPTPLRPKLLLICSVFILTLTLCVLGTFPLYIQWMDHNGKRELQRPLVWVSPEVPEVQNVDTANFEKGRRRLVCYYTMMNPGDKNYLSPESLDPYLCTHILLGFGRVSNCSIIPPDENALKIYKAVIGLKSKNPKLRVMLSVGEISSSGVFSEIVSTEENRNKFASQSLLHVKNLGFDGLDLDWEYPDWPPNGFLQKYNFTKLLQCMNLQIKMNYPGMILSLAVAAPKVLVDMSYEVEAISKCVDFVSIMTYDFHVFTDGLPVTGPNAPLYRRPLENSYMSTLNTNWTSLYWVEKGMPKEQINVGIPTYAHPFRLLNPDNTNWYAPSSGYGKTGGGGFATYGEVCVFLSNVTTVKVYDLNYRVPYAYNGLEWISYDNVISVEEKAMFIINNQFGGGMLYSLNDDDFDGTCGQTNFPLTKALSTLL